MELINDLYLKKEPKATVLVDESEHIYRARAAADGLVSKPVVPELDKEHLTLKHLWLKATEQNADKSLFGYRPLIKVSLMKEANPSFCIVMTNTIDFAM
jgi:long-chain acyl-CoA synthetase